MPGAAIDDTLKRVLFQEQLVQVARDLVEGGWLRVPWALVEDRDPLWGWATHFDAIRRAVHVAFLGRLQLPSLVPGLPSHRGDDVAAAALRDQIEILAIDLVDVKIQRRHYVDVLHQVNVPLVEGWQGVV